VAPPPSEVFERIPASVAEWQHPRIDQLKSGSLSITRADLSEEGFVALRRPKPDFLSATPARADSQSGLNSFIDGVPPLEKFGFENTLSELFQTACDF
jgi:hypothetical protein